MHSRINNLRLVPLLLILMLLYSPTNQAQEVSSTPTLDLIIALDVSGSMDIATDRNNYDRIDSALRLLYTPDSGFGVDNIPATDPNGDRFTITQMALNWLAGYAVAQDDELAINASVVTFEEMAEVLLDWTTLNRPPSQATPSVGELIPDLREQRRGSDFRALYTTIEQQLANSPGGSQSRRALIVITDSVPCLRADTVSNELAPFYDLYCANVDRMSNHIASLPDFSGNVGEVVLFLNPISSNLHWAEFSQVRTAWTSRIGDSALVNLDSISDLSNALMDSLMQEVAITRGVVTLEEANQRPSLSEQDYARMGIAYSEIGTFTTSPYQSYMDVLVAAPNTQAVVSFDPPGGTDPGAQNLLTADIGQLRLFRVRQPVPGRWNVRVGSSGSVSTWVMFRPSEARMTLTPERPTRYIPQRLSYQLIDVSGDAIEFIPEVLPNFNISISRPGSTDPIDLSTMEIDIEDPTRLISPSFIPVDPGLHRLNVDVGPGIASVWNTPNDYSFLTPDHPDLQVGNVSFNADYEIVADDGIDFEVTADTVRMPRSLLLRVALTATHNNSAIPLPDGLEARLHLTPQDGKPNACAGLEADQIIPITTDRQQAERSIRFINPGECEIDIELLFRSPLPPLNDEAVALNVAGLSRLVSVTSTDHLNIVLRAQDGSVVMVDDIDRESTRPHFTINHLRTSLPPWNPSSLVVRLEVIDENNRPINPQFLEGERSVDREHCVTQVLQNTTIFEAGDGEVEGNDPLPEVDEQRIVPFDLRVINASEVDISRSEGICFYATDSDGIYLATITGLDPGDYSIRITLNRARPALDYSRFEYNPALFSDQNDNSYEITARLRVDFNLAIAMQIAAAVIVVGVVLAGSLISIVARYQKTRAPLKVQPEIYRIPIDITDKNQAQQPAERLWSGKCPERNQHTFEMTEFADKADLIVLGIQKLTADTRKDNQISRNQQAFFTLETQAGGRSLNDQLLNAGDARLITIRKQYKYYFVNSPAGQVTIGDLQEADGKQS